MESEKFKKTLKEHKESFTEETSAVKQLPQSKRGKMDRKQRAKQFMPFSALKGLEEALAVEELKREE